MPVASRSIPKLACGRRIAIRAAIPDNPSHNEGWGPDPAARMADDIILETRQLTKEFKGFVAVQGVNLKVRRGTIHALIGPTGAGKTTCFNLLTNFLAPTTGRIVFNERDMTAVRPSAIVRMDTVRSSQISATVPALADL